MKKLTMLALAMAFVLLAAGCAKQATNTNQQTQNDNSNQEATNQATAKEDTNQEDADITAMKSYDGKVYTISSTDGKVEGQIGFQYTDKDGYPLLYAAVFLKIEDSYPSGDGTYPYIGQLTKEGDERSDHSGSVSPKFCNEDLVVNVLDSFDDFSGVTQPYSDCAQELGVQTAFMDPLFYTNHFTTAYGRYDYTEIFEKDMFYIFNGTGITKQDEYGEVLDSDKTAAEGPIQASYILTYSE